MTHTVTYDRYSLIVDGRRVVLFGGEYQFWRTPAPKRWPVVLAEMRAAGLDEVTVGVSWQYHSPKRGVYDFSGIRDLGRFLDDAAAAGLYVIARPGPAYNAESSASNLPGWLLTRGDHLRDNRGSAYCGADDYSPAYAAAYTDWYRHVVPIIAAHQLTNGGGTVIAMQIENEYLPRCGTTRYMTELHDLARELGIDVPLLANNNTCCTPAGAWHIPGDDGEPIVDIPAEDDYPCPATCPRDWGASIFSTVDSMETRLRGAGVTDAPIAVAELQGGYFTGWGGPSYSQIGQVLGPSFREMLDGSALGQGATMISLYMAAGGTSWGYLAGPNTATSYDYDAPIHEWGDPGATYGALKRTGMFVQAFGDALAATDRISSVTATNANLLYAARRTVDGAQRGAQFIVLRNTDAHHAQSTRLQLVVDGVQQSIPRAETAVEMPPHSLYLLLAGYNLGPYFRLRYSTSRPLTHVQIDGTPGGTQIAVFYGDPGTPGETALAFAHAPALLRVDPGIIAHYDAARGELLLDYRHEEHPRYVVLSYDGHRLELVLTGPEGAAHTWLQPMHTGTALVMGPTMVDAADAGHTIEVRGPVEGAMPLTVWAPDGGRSLAVVSARTASGIAPAVLPRVGSPRHPNAVYLRQPLTMRYDAGLGAVTAAAAMAAPRLGLPALTRWRFHLGSPEINPSFDDSHWVRADEPATTNPNVPRTDTLLADDYGFHYGFVWYRGTFTGARRIWGLRLYARNSYSVWLNGRYLGSSSVHNDLKNVDDQLAVADPSPNNATYADGLFFYPPRGLIKVGARNTIAVLVESLGHNSGFANGERARSPMGLLDATLMGSRTPVPIAWKIQGGVADDSAAPRSAAWSPLNASGLYGERHGWFLPSFDDRSWPWVSVPDTWTARHLNYQGVGWYRTAFDLNLPAGVDAPIGLVIPHAEDKVLIWLNGLLIGQYWEGVGPQHVFYLPAGLLNEHGSNVLALAVWNRGQHGGLTGGVYLRPYNVSAQMTLRVEP